MRFDVIIIGAGAAGMMCAAQAGQRGRRVLLIDHADKIGERIRISGGGRCNFTNTNVTVDNFLSQNKNFVRSALARYGPLDFIKLIQRYHITYHEKTLGQLFCDDSAQQIITMLRTECNAGQVEWLFPCQVLEIAPTEQGYLIHTAKKDYSCDSLVIATGGLAIPKLGATPFGYRIAEQFSIPIQAPQPALVPLALPPEVLASIHHLSGTTISVRCSCPPSNTSFMESLLITHTGLSGPAILQVSSYWQMQHYQPSKKQPISINLMPDQNISTWINTLRHSPANLSTLLSEQLPKRFAQEWCALHGWQKPLVEHSNKDINAMILALSEWKLMPSGTLGYAKAEVTLGGVDTQALSSKTMATLTRPNLYFIGEVVDVTGWLGGYNFQWAWSSGWVAGQVV